MPFEDLFCIEKYQLFRNYGGVIDLLGKGTAHERFNLNVVEDFGCFISHQNKL